MHSGSDQSPAAQRRKCERDLRILKLELAEQPDHTFTLFNLGMTCKLLAEVCEGSPELWLGEAAGYLRRSIAQSTPDQSHQRKAFAILVPIEMLRGNLDRALEECRQGRALFPLDLELRFLEGRVLHDLGRLAEARSAYERVLTEEDEWHLTSIDRDLTGFKVRQNLASVAASMGDLAEAERQWFEVVRHGADHRLGWRMLGDTLIEQRRFADAGRLADQMMQIEAIRVESHLLTARVAMAQTAFRRCAGGPRSSLGRISRRPGRAATPVQALRQ